MLEAKDLTFTRSAHYNGGKEWFGHGYQCLQDSRITMIRRYYRKTRSHEDTWRFCEKDMLGLSACVEAANRSEGPC